MSLIGPLSEMKLGDGVRPFAEWKKPGLLMASVSGRETLIRFEKGGVVHAIARRLQGEDAIRDAFGWTEGQLTFVPEEKTVASTVAHGVEALILEGARDGPAFHRMTELRPHVRLSFQF